MTRKCWIQLLFAVGALYDGLLGAAFLFAGPQVFAAFGVTPPNHWGYVQFPACLLLVFALMFAAIAKDPQKNRGLIPYGILLKLSYCGVIGAHWLGSGIPRMWNPFAVGDFIFMLLFAGAWLALAKPAEPAQT